MTKVEVTKQVAEAIAKLRELGADNTDIIICASLYEYVDHDAKEVIYDWVNHVGESDTLMNALVNGYEIEKSPEDKVREYYEGITKLVDKFNEAYDNGALQSVRHTLDLLGIKIEGVND